MVIILAVVNTSQEAPTSIKWWEYVTSIGYELVSEGVSEWLIDWEWLYGNLDTGDYRIVKDILDFRGSGDYDTYYLAAKFTVN